MRVRGFADYRPRQKARALIDAVNEVLHEYADYLPLTLRQIFYSLVASGITGKTENEYATLLETMNRARRGELVPFEAIRDDGVTVSDAEGYRDAADILRTVEEFVETVTLDRQNGQDRRIQVWCEAGGMVPQLERVARPYGVSVVSSGGFDSVTTKHDQAWKLSDRPTTILHIGDHDPSGVHIFSSLAEDIRAFAEYFDGDIDFIRLAVTPEQVELYDLPTTPAKVTDNRSFAGETVQCEALPPTVLAGIVEDAITFRLDRDAYDAVLEQEKQCRAELRERFA